MLYQILVLIHDTNVGDKIVSSCIEILAQSPTCRMDTRETPAAKAVALQREPRDICVLATESFPYPRRNAFSTDWPVLLLLPREREVTHDDDLVDPSSTRDRNENSSMMLKKQVLIINT